MGEYAVEKREITPKNFFAGDFPTVPETGTADVFLSRAYSPICLYLLISRLETTCQ